MPKSDQATVDTGRRMPRTCLEKVPARISSLVRGLRSDVVGIIIRYRCI